MLLAFRGRGEGEEKKNAAFSEAFLVLPLTCMIEGEKELSLGMGINMSAKRASLHPLEYEYECLKWLINLKYNYLRKSFT